MKSTRDLIVLVLVAASLTVLTGCGDTKCTMDTECPLPQVCVSGACVMRAQDGGPFDTIPDSIFPDMDAPDTPPDGADVDGGDPDEDDGEEDPVV